MKKWFRSLKNPFTEAGGVKWGFRLVFVVSLLTLIGYELYLFQSRSIKDIALVVGLTVTVIPGGFFLLSHIYDQIKKLPSSVIFYLGSAVVAMAILFSSYRSEIGNYIAIGNTILTIFLLGFFCYTIFYVFYYKKAYFNKLWIRSGFHLILVVSLVLSLYIWVYEGLPAEAINNAMDSFQSDVSFTEVEASYDVTYGIYGNEKYLNTYDFQNEHISETASVSYFLGSWGDSRAGYLGHNVFDVPLNGRYYLPQGQGPFPVVLLVHGNHEMVQASEIGYDYLGRYLAERGYFVVSVDENCFNYSTFDSEIMDESIGSENDARAYILLSHLKYLEKENKRQDSIFHNLLDYDNIALMGHSRGGEAVAIAEYFNRIKTLPNDYRKHLQTNYNIRSVVAIAPTDGQFQPANRYIELENVNYLLLHGSNDMDVSYMSGNNQYERVFLSDPDFFKASVWIYGANHGYFNETWYPYDTSPIGGKVHNISGLLERQEQEAIASQLIYYFLESTLGNRSYQAGFKNISAFQDLPDTLYMTQYNEGSDQVIANFSEDHYLETATMEGVSISASGLKKWYEGTSKLKGRKSQIHGAYIEFEGYYDGGLIFEHDQVFDLSLSDKVYVTLSDMTSDNDELTDAYIEITDVNHVKSQLSLSHVGLLQHYFEVVLTKFPWFEDTNRVESHLQSFELAIEDFDNIGNVDMDQIKTLSIVFPDEQKRKIFIKEIGIRK